MRGCDDDVGIFLSGKGKMDTLQKWAGTVLELKILFLPMILTSVADPDHFSGSI
jgi:hypothetical protein